MNAEDRFDDVVSRRKVLLSNYIDSTVKAAFYLRFFLGHGKTLDAPLTKMLLEFWQTYEQIYTIAIAAELKEDQIPKSFLQSGLFFTDTFLGYIAVPDKRSGGPYTVTMELPLWAWNSMVADQVRLYDFNHPLAKRLSPDDPRLVSSA